MTHSPGEPPQGKRLSNADQILECAKSAAQKADERQLNAYLQASGLYAQIGAFQTYLLASSTLFVTLTVGAWAAILASDLNLQQWVEIPLLVAHLLACVWLTAIVYGTSRSIRARFVMFDALGSRFFPWILVVGLNSFGGHPSNVLAWATLGRKGKIGLLWLLLPLVGFVGSLYLLIDRVL